MAFPLASQALLSPAFIERCPFQSSPGRNYPTRARSGSSICNASVTTVHGVESLTDKSVSELRKMAKERGIHGDTKAELVKLLSTLDPVSSNGKLIAGSNGYVGNGHVTNGKATNGKSNGNGNGNGKSSVRGAGAIILPDVKTMKAMKMSELRNLARELGITGATRAELVKELVGNVGKPSPGLSKAVVIGNKEESPIDIPSTPTPVNIPSEDSAASPSASTGLESGGAKVSSYEKSLQSKSIGDLRALARKLGLRGDTKPELVKMLLTIPPSLLEVMEAPVQAVSSAAPVAAPKPPPPAPELKEETGANVEAALKKEATKPKTEVPPEKLGKRVAMVKAADKGLAKEGEEEEAVAAEAVVESKGEVAVEDEEAKTKAKVLEGMTMGELRYLARQRGLRGDTKEELVKLLIEGPPLEMHFFSSAPTPLAPKKSRSTPIVPSPPPLIPSQPPTPSPAPVAALSTVAESSPVIEVAAENSALGDALPALGLATEAEVAKEELPSEKEREKELQVKSLGELRAMAREKGLRGDTKAELVHLLLRGESPSTVVTATSERISPLSEAVSPSSVLPPFESDVSNTDKPTVQSVVEPKKLVAEVSLLKAAMEAMKAKEQNLEEERQTLVQETGYFRNVIVGGIALAVIPLLLPLAVSNIVTKVANPSEQIARQLGEETAVLLETLLRSQSDTLDDLQTLLPLVSPDVAPDVRASKAEEFCRRVPANLRAPQTEKFCKAVAELDSAKLQASSE